MAKKTFYSALIIAFFAMIFVSGASAKIIVSPKTMNLKVGQTATLTVQVIVSETEFPGNLLGRFRVSVVNPDIVWMTPSDSFKVLFYDITYSRYSILSASVKALRKGTTTIRFINRATDIVESECTVKVTDPADEIWPQSATLVPKQLTLYVGEETYIRADVLPVNYNVGNPSWSMDNQQIISVQPSVKSKGRSAKVTGRAVGSTTLRFSIGNVTTSCPVTVTKKISPESATLVPKQLTLYVGEDANIRADVQPANFNAGISSWSMDDQRIISFQPKGRLSAIVHGRAAGTTTFRLYIGGVRASCLVTVKERIWPESATLVPKQLTLFVGEQATIKANVQPTNYDQGTPEWSINDKQLASVTPDNTGLSAVVKGLARGTTTLHFTVVNAYTSCVVTVIPRPNIEPNPEFPNPKISLVTLNLPMVTINGDRKSFRLEAFVQPANAASSVLQWSSSDPSVASVEAAPTASLLKAGVTSNAVIVHIHKKGKAEITALATDGSGKKASCQVEVLSTVGNIEATNARIYASAGTLHLSLPQAAAVQIYNLIGRPVHSFSAPAGETSVALPAGVYVVRVGETVEKIFVK